MLGVQHSGRVGAGGQLGQESVERARELGDNVLLGMSLGVYASVVHAAESGRLCAEAIACAERSGDICTRLVVHNNAGFIALGMGDIPAAQAHLETAVRAAEVIGVPHFLALGNLAEILRAEHDLGGA